MSEIHDMIQDAIKNGECVSIVEMIDYIENKYNVRYNYGRILHEMYAAGKEDL